MRRILITLVFLQILTWGIFAQRKMEKLDRGVVAVKNNSGLYFSSWRHLASDPDNIQYNLYAKNTTTQTEVKLNATPLSVTNFQTTAGQVSNNSELFVKPIINGIEGLASGSFKVVQSGFTTYRSAYLDITYDPANDGLALSKYTSKFVWPADLDGDGEYDFVVDRLNIDGTSTHKIQAYLRNGTLLWTVDVGPNVSICQGQDDMVISYDMDGDGKAEVVIKSSDGSIFSDGKGVNGTSIPFDTDGDGIVNYENQSVKNPPQYITVIDGMTGKEKNSIEMKYPSNYTRTNKSVFMGDEYSNLNGHMAIVYLDGKHPDVGFVYKTRTASDQYHWYYASAYGYDNSGNWVNKYNWERGYTDAAEFHSIRSADVDGDGRDELLDGGYGIKYDGKLAFNAHIHHGDRFRVGDIDPERPGLETFAIQQNSPDMLGMILYDSSTGDPIKKIFMAGVGDVGRGECMDVDPAHPGYEFWSTMSNIYDAKGNVIFEGGSPWPFEGIWWDGDLAREELSASDGNGFNADIRKYDPASHSFGSRPIEFAKMTSWQVNSEYGVRPAFFGDIAGDWREEVILEKHSTATDGTVNYTGFVGFSTDYPTSTRLYCLMQNPAYRMQCTTKGYYQSAFPDYYLGYGMPAPPVSPVQEAKLTWNTGNIWNKSASNWKTWDEKSTSTFQDGDDLMFDISGDNSKPIEITEKLAPSKLWAMNPLAKDFILNATSGTLSGTMELTKSMIGNFTLNGNYEFTGKTIISEGTLTVNGNYMSPVEIRAKGTMAGNAVLNGGLILQPALNLEGSRLAPGRGLESGMLGKITINTNLTLNGKTNMHFDILPLSDQKNDSILINGDFTVAGTNNIVISTLDGNLPSGEYALIKWTGNFSGSLDNFKIKGLSGIPMKLEVSNKTLLLVVSSVREASKVHWTGSQSANWDFTSNNFEMFGQPTYFVTGDSVLIDDDAVNATISLSDQFNCGFIDFSNQSKTIALNGTGGIAGSGDLKKTGKGLLILGSKNTYTGKTIFDNAKVQLESVSDAGIESSLGSAAIAAGNISFKDSKILINSTTGNTNRGISLTGSDTLQVLKPNGIISLTGVVAGTGKLVFQGPGQLNLSGSVANTYSGGTFIGSGLLALGSTTMNNSGLGNGSITLGNGSKLRMYYTTGYGQSPRWNLTVPDGASASLDCAGRCDINGTISGNGTLNYYVPYVRADLVSNCTNFTGKINVITDGDGGDFRITANATGLPKTQVILNDKVYMAAYTSVGSKDASASTQVAIGSLEGTTASSLGVGNWIVGSDNRDATFRGTISSSATLSKVGTGSWTITSANTSTSAVNISGGSLVVANTTGSATGTGAVSVRNGATLAGNGSVAGAVVLYSGSTLSPGNGSIGTLSINNSISLQAGSRLLIKRSETKNDMISLTGTCVLKGDLEMQNFGGEYKAGQAFTLVNGAVSGQFANIIPETPGVGLKWNQDRISQGIITVDFADGTDIPTENSYHIYPTHTSDFVFVETPSKPTVRSIRVTDLQGRIMMEEILLSGVTDYKLDIAPLSKGSYLLSISEGNQLMKSVKIIKI